MRRAYLQPSGARSGVDNPTHPAAGYRCPLHFNGCSNVCKSSKYIVVPMKEFYVSICR